MVKPRGTDKCPECRRRKILCRPIDRDCVKQRCNNCEKKDLECGPNERKGTTIIGAQQSQETIGMAMQLTRNEVRESLKESSRALDAEVVFFNQAKLRLKSLDTRESQGRVLHENSQPQHDLLRRLHTSSALAIDLQAKLNLVESLADKVVDIGDQDAAEIAYMRLLETYRSLEPPAFEQPFKLLIKVAKFFVEVRDEPIRAEYLFREALRQPYSPRRDEVSPHRDDVWRDLYTALKRSSNAVSKIAQAKEIGPGLATDGMTPFPPLHRMFRAGEESMSLCPEEFFQPDGPKDITGSPVIHSTIIGGNRSDALHMIRNYPDTELKRRDHFERSPLFLAALFQEEEIGYAILERFTLHDPTTKELLLSAQDDIGQTILAVAILNRCCKDFIKKLLHYGAKAEQDPLVPHIFTPLKAAAFMGREDIVRLLMDDHNAVADSTFMNELTAAQLAQKHGHHGVAQLLSTYLT